MLCFLSYRDSGVPCSSSDAGLCLARQRVKVSAIRHVPTLTCAPPPAAALRAAGNHERALVASGELRANRAGLSDGLVQRRWSPQMRAPFDVHTAWFIRPRPRTSTLHHCNGIVSPSLCRPQIVNLARAVINPGAAWAYLAALPATRGNFFGGWTSHPKSVQLYWVATRPGA